MILGFFLPWFFIHNKFSISYGVTSSTNAVGIVCSTALAVAAIDNMVKGAAGQAIQNMNIIFGLDEKTGLEIVPPAF